jgi:hypothetical protein
MAKVMKFYFKEALYTLPLNYDSMPHYPSPKELIGKIILKSSGDFQEALREIDSKIICLYEN